MIRYRCTKENERYDRVSEIGNWNWSDGYELTDEPFDMETFYLYRWDKNIQAWVEGEIDEETGEWQLKTE